MNSLLFRLTVAFVLIVSVIVALVILAINHSVDNSFRTYLTRNSAVQNHSMLIRELENHYALTGSWQGVQNVSLPGQGNQHGRGQGHNEDHGAQLLVTDNDFRIIAATSTDLIGEKLNGSLQSGTVPLTVDGQTVGYFLRQSQSNELIALTETTFLDEIRHALMWAAIAALIGALLLGILFAWWLIRPLYRLRMTAHQVADGQLGMQAPVGGAKEIQEVALAFNHMSTSLADSEATRKRMMSDIAHELRTPLSVMRGQLEGMMDGIVAADTQHIGTVYNQTLHLARLVADLWTLTRAEAKILPLEQSQTDISILVSNVGQEFMPLAQDANIRLVIEANSESPIIQVDQGRIRQVLSNLMVNALRHTPEGGHIAISTQQNGSGVSICVADTGEGLSTEDQEHIFERFFRSDRSRQSSKGGAGLGLAIARELIVLHGGDIVVDSKIGEGSRFTITLPT